MTSPEKPNQDLENDRLYWTNKRMEALFQFEVASMALAKIAVMMEQTPPEVPAILHRLDDPPDLVA